MDDVKWPKIPHRTINIQIREKQGPTLWMKEYCDPNNTDNQLDATPVYY